MNKRRKLIQQVKGKITDLEIGDEQLNTGTTDSSDCNRFFNGKLGKQREGLIEAIIEKGYTEIIEEIACIWFIRWISIRYMEINGYLPKSFSRQSFMEKCNSLNEIFPLIFQPKGDYSEILFPDHLLEDDYDIISFLNSSKDNFEGVEIIGWLYQYYISEKHDEVVGINHSRIRKEDIPAATQLFTPKWIVKYMVDNSLGKLWLEASGDKILQKKLEYYLHGDSNQSLEKSLNSVMDPRNIKILDPACGCGHILVYAFDVLYDIYLHSGYPSKEIPKLILTYNLYGLDIDEKPAALAYFALVMKALEKDKHFIDKIKKEEIQLNICAIEESNGILENKKLLLKGLAEIDRLYGRKEIDNLLECFYDGKEYGSIIHMKELDFEFWDQRLKYLIDCPLQWNNHPQIKKLIKILPKLMKQGRIMDQKYDIVIANPPYMANKMMSMKLKKYVDAYFKDFNGDLFSVFIKRNLDYTKENGYSAFMTPFVWMFIKTYEKLRKYIIKNTSITSLIQLEYSSFEDATVPICTFVLSKKWGKVKGHFIGLSDFKGSDNQSKKVLEAIKNRDVPYRYESNTKDFKKMSGMPIAYWVSDAVREGFKKGKPLQEIADARVGLQTSDNKRFLRLWYEVDIGRIGFGFHSRDEAKERDFKWFPYNKGGQFRKWYGNNTYVVNWEGDGREIREYNAHLNESRDSNIGIANTSYYFKKGITWSFVSSSNFGVRFSPGGFIFDTAGSSAFPKEEDMYFLMGFMCSKITYMYLRIINPTLNFQPGNIAMVPVIYPDSKEAVEKINLLSMECIGIAKDEWDAYEASWDFKRHPFLWYRKRTKKIQEAFNFWNDFTQKQFRNLKENEESINDIFINIYGLKDEISPTVLDKDITLRKGDKKKDILSFISYAIGCIFGRYSLDEEGLIFAGGEFDHRKYKQFTPVEDGILPIIGEPYFQGDMTDKFMEFVAVVFGQETLEANLDYIANVLDRRDNEESKECIRRYFLNEFYGDHLKVYQNRPIYWLFTSGKYKAFNSFVYIHRYNHQNPSEKIRDYIQKIQETLKQQEGKLHGILKEGCTDHKKKEVQKQIHHINKQRKELMEYDYKIQGVENIPIDLDDGVQNNYQKLSKLLAKI